MALGRPAYTLRFALLGLTDPGDQVDRGPALNADELPGRGLRLAECTANRLVPADRPGDADRHAALGAGERARPDPGRPLRGAKLDAGSGCAEPLLVLWIGLRRWIEVKAHTPIIALSRRNSAAAFAAV
jgi:hypothetical protein